MSERQLFNFEIASNGCLHLHLNAPFNIWRTVDKFFHTNFSISMELSQLHVKI